MARRVNFGGTSIVVPGAYSSLSTNLVGSTPALPIGRVGIIGGASKGAPGSAVGVLEFTSVEMQSLVNYYGSGPIVDAARAIFNPSNDPRIRQGANRLFVWKTDASTQASLALATGFGTLSDQNYGAEGNIIYSSLTLSPEVVDVKSSDAIADPTFNAGVDLNSTTLSARVDGGALATFTFSAVAANHDSLAEVVADLNGSVTGVWAPSNPGLLFSIIDSSHIGVALAAGSNEHRNGRGRSFEIVGGSAQALLQLDSASLLDVLCKPSLENSMRIQVARQLDSKSEDSDTNSGNVGGKIYLEIGCLDATCTLSISSSALTTSAATAADLNLQLSLYPTLNDLAAYLNSIPAYKCSIPANVNGSLSPSVLDRVSAIGIAYSGSSKYPGRVKADSYSVANWFSSYSGLCSLSQTSHKGLPDAVSSAFLSGGARGASLSSDFIAGLSAMEAEDINIIVPLVSQDSSDDQAEDQNITDSTSAYDAESILLATKNHCKLMGSVINRKERQCYLGYRNDFESCKNEAMSLNSEVASLLIQDVQLLGSDGNMAWNQPHMAACLVAGMQAGAEIGQPSTFKLISANGIRHVKKQGLTPSAIEKFEPRTQAPIAIENGIMCLDKPASGGIRIVRQISTYLKDDNFAYIAPSVMSAAFFVAMTLRTSLEAAFVGEKARTGAASSIQSMVIAVMSDMLKQDIIVGDDTNGMLGWKNLTVQLLGNAAYVDITITPVQGIDFILNRITLDNIRASA